MKIKLNLLPDKNKKKLRTTRYFWLILDQELHVVIVIIILILGLLGINFVISYEITNLENSIKTYGKEKNSKEIKEIREKFKKSNLKVRNINNLINGGISWNYLFSEISKNVDDKIAIKSVKVENTLIKIKAVANERADAIDFKEKMIKLNFNNEPCFEGVAIPAQDLVSSKFVEFNLTASILKNCVILNKDKDSKFKKEEKTKLQE